MRTIYTQTERNEDVFIEFYFGKINTQDHNQSQFFSDKLSLNNIFETIQQISYS